MSFIHVSFAAPDLDDVVAALQVCGFPVRGKAERFFVLHDNGHVSQWATTLDAHRALQIPGSELLLWLLEEAAVAAVVVVEGARLRCRLGLAGAPRHEQQAAARAVERLLAGLAEVEVEAELE